MIGNRRHSTPVTSIFRLSITTALVLAATLAHGSPETRSDKLQRDPSRPAKPVLKKIAAVSLFEIDLTWRDNSTNEDGFQIERSKDQLNFRQIAQVLPGTTVYRDKNLFPGTRYFYRIRAFNASGSSGYDTGSRRTPSPPRPLTVVEWGNTNGVAPTNQDFVSISAGNYHTLALRKDGTVVGWGDNFYGEATPPTNLTGVVAISAGNTFSLALKDDGTVVGWGDNFNDLAALPTGLTNVVAISAGVRHAVALKGDGTVVAWGWPYDGITAVPPGLSGVVAISAGLDISLALKSDGTVVAWGSGYAGGTVLPTDLNSVTAIAAGPGYALAARNDGSVVGWGYDTCGITNHAMDLTNVYELAAGEDHSVALNDNGTLSDWGCYFSGVTPPDLGDGAVAISARGYHFAALSTSPSRPAGLSAVVLAANKIRLSWQDSIGERGFRIERAADTGYPNQPVWTEIGRVHNNKTNFTDSTLTVDTTYWYRVCAFSRFGTSPYSTPSAVVTTPLAAPQNLIADVGSNQVNLTWSDFPDFQPLGYIPYSGIDGFKIERAPDDNGTPGAWAEIGSQTSSVQASNATPQNDYGFFDTTVQPDTTYWYRVRAFNILGLSDYSASVSIGVLPPPIPQGLYTFVYKDQIQLSWIVDPASAQGVKIERAPDVNGSPGAWTEIAETDSPAGSYQDAGLSVNTTYWYRARAFNWVGDSPYTDPVSVTILPPSPPSSFSASINPTNGVLLEWSKTPNDEDGFELDRAPDAGGVPGTWTQIASFTDTNAYAESFTDTNVVANATYWYRVRAFNSLGVSDYSDVSIGLVAPSAPSSLTAQPIANRVDLNWVANWTGPVGSFQGRGFEIERALDADGIPGNWTQIATIPPGRNTSAFYSDTNLAAGATYWYRVRAFNWIGDSPYSGLAVVTILPPTVPGLVSASISTNANQINLSWYDFGNDFGNDEDGFYIERASDSGHGLSTWTQIGSVQHGPVNNDSFIDTNATAFATNWYRVRAYNVVGISDYGPAGSIAVVPPTAPSAFGHQASDNAVIEWYDDNSAATGTAYKIERAPDVNGSPGTWTQIAQVGGGTGDTYTDPDLPGGAVYWYRVRAFNWIGNSDYSAPIKFTFVPPVAPPYAPWVSIGASNNQVDVYSYDLNYQDGLAIERAPDLAGNPGTWTEIGRLDLTNDNNYVLINYDFTDTNAIANTTNWYRIRAFNASGLSAPSDAAQLTIVPPDAPVISGNAFVNRANLSWYDPSTFSAGVTGFKLERAPSVSPAFGTWTELTNTPDTEYTDLGLAPKNAYWYRVSSHNWVGDSPFSDPISITMSPPEIPDEVLAGLGTTNQVNLTIYDPATDEDGFKIERVAMDDTNGTWVEIGTVIASNSYSASFIDTNAMPNKTYWYRARAFNINGLSDYSSVAIVSTAAPRAPTSLDTSALRNTIYTYWSASDKEGISGFHIDRAPDVGGSPGTWTTIGTNSGFITDYIDHDLSARTTYWYRVRAFNWVGESPSSSPARATINPPARPAGVICNPGTTNQGIVTWYDSALDEDGFNIERAPDNGGVPGAWAPIGSINITNYYSGTFTDTNVPANSTNWYRVQAFNSVGSSQFSGSNSLVVVAPATAPTLDAGVVALHQINLNWYTDYGFIEGYTIERAFDTNDTPGTWVQIADQLTGYDNGEYADTVVTAGRKYWYRVRAHNWAGSSPWSNAVLVDDDPPAAPVLAAANDLPNQITLTWNKTAGNPTRFKLERAADNGGVPGPWIQIAEQINYQNSSPFQTTYVDRQIPVGQTYWYRVRASNPVGDSPYSNEASATSRNGQFIRVMQWDVKGALGRIENNSGYTASAAGNIVNYNHPDVLLLNGIDAQGLTAAQNRDALIDWVTNQLTYLGSAPGATFYVAASAQSDGLFRNAVISRFPILNETNCDDGFRGLHAFQVQIPDTNVVQIFQTQFATNDCALKQAEAEFDSNVISSFAATNSLPYIFAGDLNEDEDAPLCTLSDTYHPISTIRQGAALGDFKPATSIGNDNTWSTWVYPANERLDYVLSATNRISPISGYVFSTEDLNNQGIYGYIDYDYSSAASDHYPLVATFYFHTPTPASAPANSSAAGNGQTSAVGLIAWRLSTYGESTLTPLSLVPAVPQIIALTPMNNGVLVEWSTTGGSTDTLQALDSVNGMFSNISPPLLIAGSGSTTTNYLDTGALSNGPARFYRIQSSH